MDSTCETVIDTLKTKYPNMSDYEKGYMLGVLDGFMNERRGKNGDSYKANDVQDVQ